MRQVFFFILCLLLPASAAGQRLEVTGARKKARTAGDVLLFAAPAAGIATTLALKDWQGLKQGSFTALTTVGTTLALKYLIHKERPDHSDDHSMPSMHTAVTFTAATYIGRRYGWKWSIPAYAVSAYVAWSRVYGKKHDWWDVAAGAAIGTASAFAFTRPRRTGPDITFVPTALPDGAFGFYSSISF